MNNTGRFADRKSDMTHKELMEQETRAGHLLGAVIAAFVLVSAFVWIGGKV